MKKYFFSSKKLLFVTIILTILVSIATISIAYILQDLVDISISGNMNRLKKAVYLTITFIIAFKILSYLQRTFKKIFIKNIMYTLKRDIFKSILAKDISSFNSRNSADYISILNNDIALAEQDYFIIILIGFEYIFSFIAGTYALFKLNFYIAISLLIAALIPIFIPVLFQEKMRKRKKDYSDSLSSFIIKIKDMFSGFEVIKSFNIEDKIEEDFHNANMNVEDKKCKSGITEVTIDTLSEFFIYLMNFLPIILGAYLTIKGSFTAGGTIAALQLSSNIVNPLFNFSSILNRIKGIKPINEKIESVIVQDKSNNLGIKKDSFEDSIQFKNVSFSYNGERQILNNINLTIDNGEKIAIVGKSGSGKSTLLKLLLRYYENYDGEIFIDDVEIRNFKIDSLYNLISIIQQNVFMFDDSIKSNIALYGNYTENKIDEVIRLSGLKEFVETLSNGKETEVGENGCNISGGEKQRISIARALIKNTKILLLDEATASLDIKTSYEIEQSILDIEGLTSIVVTHKLNEDLLQRYDKIIILENGRIVEEGSFDELIDRNGFFYSLYTVEKAV